MPARNSRKPRIPASVSSGVLPPISPSKPSTPRSRSGCAGALHRARHGQRAGEVAAAGTAAGAAAFQQQIDRCPRPVALDGARQHLHSRHGIDEAVEFESGIGGELLQDIADRLAADELIGKHDALDAHRSAHLHLLRRRHRHRPGAVGELPAEQRRAHGGLAVGRDHGARQLEEGLHPAVVVVDGGGFQHRRRQRQVLPQEVPALGADLPQGKRRHARRHALDETAQLKVIEIESVRHGCLLHRRRPWRSRTSLAGRFPQTAPVWQRSDGGRGANPYIFI